MRSAPKVPTFIGTCSTTICPVVALRSSASARADGEPEIHRVDPEFGSTLTVSNRDSQSNCWVNLRILGQPCEFHLEIAADSKGRRLSCATHRRAVVRDVAGELALQLRALRIRRVERRRGLRARRETPRTSRRGATRGGLSGGARR